MWKRIGDDPTHYCCMWATRTYRVCKQTWWGSKSSIRNWQKQLNWMKTKVHYYKYTPTKVLENENFKLQWNRSIITDKTISSDRPDITFMNKKTKNTVLIDIAVPNTHNLAKTTIDKQNKYQDLAHEICVMWKQDAVQMIPIVISSTGVIPKSLSQSPKRLNLHPNTYIQMQKSVIFGTCSIVRNFLNYKTTEPNSVDY
jgi:hypothetical protein